MAQDIDAAFIGRALSKNHVMSCGVVPSGKAKEAHWYRLYRLSESSLELGKMVEATLGSTLAEKATISPRGM